MDEWAVYVVVVRDTTKAVDRLADVVEALDVLVDGLTLSRARVAFGRVLDEAILGDMLDDLTR